jgi:branched-chain amino acid transport system substrate-binding protein
MKRSTTTIRLAAVAAASALVLAACGSSDSEGSSDETKAAPSAAKGDGTLTIGTLLPQTGSLAFLGPPEFAGVDLAIKDINAAGGVNGKDVVGVKADSGDTDSGIAPAETDKLLKAKSDVIVGAASSGVSKTVVDKIMSAGVTEEEALERALRNSAPHLPPLQLRRSIHVLRRSLHPHLHHRQHRHMFSRLLTGHGRSLSS